MRAIIRHVRGNLYTFTTQPLESAGITSLFDLAWMLWQSGDQKQATIEYRKLIKLNPDCAEAFLNLGTLCHDRGHFQRALVYYSKAAELAPDYTLAWYNLGGCYSKLGRCEQSIHSYRRALALCPQYYDARFNLALELENHGKPGRALIEFRKAALWATNRADKSTAENSCGRILRDLAWSRKNRFKKVSSFA